MLPIRRLPRLPGIAAALACYGGSESQNNPSTTNATYNDQATTGNAAQGSVQTTTGAGSSLNEGGINATGGSVVNVTSDNAQLVAALGNTLGATANNSIIAQNDALNQALGFGAEAIKSVNTNSSALGNTLTATANNSIIAQNDALNQALGFGAEAIKSVNTNSSALGNTLAALANNSIIAQNDALNQALGFGAQAIKSVNTNSSAPSDQVASINSQLAKLESAAAGNSSPAFNWREAAVIAGLIAAGLTVAKFYSSKT
ncbi:MAG: hypothetical protein KGJ13_07010 [Patescibacteria group bacterium]|nr:hypothetical protein [Patescibacteria group bacterium]